MNYLDLTPEQQRDFIHKQNANSWTDPSEVACPYCESTQSFEYEDMTYQGDALTEHECGNCGKKFEIHSSVTWNFETEIPDEEVYDMVLNEPKATTEA